ncbi:MAG: 50S ribosome-binding GTPase [Desulfurococcales archaeon]|nr:50S ribosome-binding GTPase [Desulfurococcales archaeon]
MQVVDPREEAKRIHVPTYDEIMEKIKSRYPKGKGLKPVDREIARLQTIRNILIDKTSFVRQLVRLLDNLHPFYWRLIEIEFDRNQIHKAISCISRSRKLVSGFWDKYRFLLLASETPRELRRTSAEARGRMMSSIKRCSKGLELLRSLVVFLQHLPSINPEMPTIIVAGPPSTGKSTLINTISTASPQVAPYPFTTKNIHIGHYTHMGTRIQLIDTPGILDRNPEEMNQVERRAVAALQEIPGAVLYLVDPTPSSYMPLQDQFRLLAKIHRYTGGKPHYIAVNKVDEAPEDSVKAAIELARDMVERGLARKHYTMVARDRASASRVVGDIVEDSITRAHRVPQP